MWQEFNTELAADLTEVMEIINVALCYGFEFKVENHNLYFREVAQLSTLSTKFKIKYLQCTYNMVLLKSSKHLSKNTRTTPCSTGVQDKSYCTFIAYHTIRTMN